MGPPLKAAENAARRRASDRAAPGFNGAAAKSSGKYAANAAERAAERRASMGPPLKAAENLPCAGFPFRNFSGFNGAAAKSSGKSGRNCYGDVRALGLQWGRR